MKQQLTPKQIAKVDAVFEAYAMSPVGTGSAIEFAKPYDLSKEEMHYLIALDLVDTVNNFYGYKVSVSDFDDIEINGTETIAWLHAFVLELKEIDEEIAQTNRDIREDEAFYKTRQL